MKSYIEIIRDLREDNDKTQKEVAEYLGTTTTAESNLEFVIKTDEEFVFNAYAKEGYKLVYFC